MCTAEPIAAPLFIRDTSRESRPQLWKRNFERLYGHLTEHYLEIYSLFALYSRLYNQLRIKEPGLYHGSFIPEPRLHLGFLGLLRLAQGNHPRLIYHRIQPQHPTPAPLKIPRPFHGFQSPTRSKETTPSMEKNFREVLRRSERALTGV